MRRKVGGTRSVSGTRKHHRRSHTTKRRHSRRRRVSGVSDASGMLTKAGGLVLGAVAARELNTLIVKFFPAFSPLMSGIAQMGVGFFLPKFVKGEFWNYVADGMIANGGMVTVVSTGLISGTGNTVAYRINGTSHHRVVNGTGNMPVVSGVSAFKTVAGGTSNMPVVSGPQTRVSNNPIPGDVIRPFSTFY